MKAVAVISPDLAALNNALGDSSVDLRDNLSTGGPNTFIISADCVRPSFRIPDATHKARFGQDPWDRRTRGAETGTQGTEERGSRRSHDQCRTLLHRCVSESERNSLERQRLISPPTDVVEANKHADVATTTPAAKEIKVTTVRQRSTSESSESVSRERAVKRGRVTWKSMSPKCERQRPDCKSSSLVCSSSSCS
nr:unnamed protein product [Spirometra erinaceieuropaei]